MELEKLNTSLQQLEDELKQLEQGLKENDDGIKEAEAKIQEPYNGVSNLIFIIFSFAVTGCAVFFLSKWWIKTNFSVWTGLLLFPVAIASLIWDIGCIATSTRKYHNKTLDDYQKKLETLLQEKEEMIAKQYTVKGEIDATKDAIDNIKDIQAKAAEEEKKRNKAKLEALYVAAHLGDTVDRIKLEEAAGGGHINARIEMAKLLIDDYFSDIYTASEKKEKINIAYAYLDDFKNENDECEFLYLFCDSVIHEEGRFSLAIDLKRMREIKSSGDLSQKYDEMADKAIPKIVKQIDELERKERQKSESAYDLVELTPDVIDRINKAASAAVNGSCSRDTLTDDEALHAARTMMTANPIDISGM